MTSKTLQILREVFLNEDIKGWKNAHSDLAKYRRDATAAGHSVKLVSLKKDGGESKMHDATKTFPSEEQAHAHHQNIVKLNPGKHIAHNLYINGELKGKLGPTNESLPANAKSSDFVDDFVHSKNKMFDGDSKKQRIRRALGAYYAKKNGK